MRVSRRQVQRKRTIKHTQLKISTATLYNLHIWKSFLLMFWCWMNEWILRWGSGWRIKQMSN